MSAATETVQAEWAARAVVLSDLRKIEDWRKLSGELSTGDQSNEAISRFLRALGHGAVADQWERVR
jgi:hypothetical protein